MLRLLPLLLLLGTAQAEPVEVGKADAKAVVDALKKRALTADQHDRLVRLGELAADGLPEDRLWSGWALVRAGRAELGLPLVTDGLAGAEPTAENLLKSLILASSLGHDDLGRAIVNLAADEDERIARQWAKTVQEPPEFAVAVRGVRTSQVMTRASAVPANGHELQVWHAELPESGAQVLVIPEGDHRIGLPSVCQGRRLLKEAVAAAGATNRTVILPGLAGCDLSTGVAVSLDDRLADLEAIADAYPRAAWVGRGEAATMLLLLSARRPELTGVALDPEPLTRPWLPAAINAPWQAFGAGAVCVLGGDEDLRAPLAAAGVCLRDGRAPPTLRGAVAAAAD